VNRTETMDRIGCRAYQACGSSNPGVQALLPEAEAA
jgi:hypothetical protein